MKPEHDGQTHINIYSQGATQLGRDLSNLAPISVTVGGLTYASVEAYWYTLGCHGLSEADAAHLRGLSGLQAKKVGRALRQRHPGPRNPDFESLIRAAIQQKVYTRPALALELARSTLPLAHYYVRGTQAVDAGFEWVTETNVALRRQLQPLRVIQVSVVNVARDHGACDYLGRPFAGREGSVLANPFPVSGKGHWGARAEAATQELIRAGVMVAEAQRARAARGSELGQAVHLYRAWLKLRLRARGAEYDAVWSLAQRAMRGEHLRLGCWCAPNPCHAEIVAQAVEGMVFSSRLQHVARKVK